MLATIAGALVRGFERQDIRGAPSLLRLLSKAPSLRRALATVKLPHGQAITFPAFDAYWCRYLWASVPYERDVEQIFRKLGRGRVLVDCGANIGYWSVRAGEFGFTRVVAVEANEALLPLLRQNLSANAAESTLLHAAVYSASGETLFLDRVQMHACAGIGDKGLPVTSVALADLVRDIPPGQEIVAKLDVEGAEIAAIEGADGRAGIIFVYEDFAQHRMPVTRHLLDRGMAVFGVAPDGRCGRLASADEAVAFNAATAGRRAPSNLVACAPEQAAAIEAELRS